MELAFLNIGTQEMFVIVAAILVLFGGKKLPELARGLGKGIREFKDASEGIKREIADQINNFEKDLDVTAVDEEQKSLPTGTETLEKVEDASIVSNEEESPVADKKVPQFTAPENTYQHDPGAHPVDESEYYKYGYNDNFVSENTAETEVKKDEESISPSANTPNSQA